MTRRAQLQAAVALLSAELDALPPDPPVAPAKPAPYMTAKDYAKHLHVSPRTLRRMISEGLPVVRPRPKLIRIPVAEAAAWMAKSQRSASVAAHRGEIQ